jgi:polyisoprenoid-binding protein YceI
MRKTILTALLGIAALAANPVQAAETTFKIDPRHTFATFVYTHLGLTNVRGRFNVKESTFTIDPQARTGKAEVVIDMASVNIGFGTLEKLLNSPEVFDTARYPTATFVADRFAFEGDKLTELSGTLTLKDKSRPVTLKASQYTCLFSPVLKRNICGGEFEGAVDREAMGITFGLPAPHATREVRLIVQIEAFQM